MSTITRRAALAGSAALPALPMAFPAGAETDDPAISAVRRWVEADKAERDYYSRADVEWENNPIAQALEAETARRHWEMAQIGPTTIEGLALLLAAALFDGQGSDAVGTSIDAPETWGLFDTWADGRNSVLLRTALSSPIGADLVRRATA